MHPSPFEDLTQEGTPKLEDGGDALELDVVRIDPLPTSSSPSSPVPLRNGHQRKREIERSIEPPHSQKTKVVKEKGRETNETTDPTTFPSPPPLAQCSSCIGSYRFCPANIFSPYGSSLYCEVQKTTKGRRERRESAPDGERVPRPELRLFPSPPLCSIRAARMGEEEGKRVMKNQEDDRDGPVC